MSYDKSKDMMLVEIGYIKVSEREDILLEIYSYAGGPPKVQIRRKIHTQRGTITGHLGRLTREEARLIGSKLSAAAEDDTLWSGR